VDEIFRSGGDGSVLIGVIGLGLGGDVAPFLELAVDEESTGSHQWDELGSCDSMPALLRRVEQLVDTLRS